MSGRANASVDRIRIAVDIGGTFSDVALEVGGLLTSAKVLTTPHAPELGVMEACADVLRRADLSFGDVDLLIHGTTLATNALIERKGARTALIATQGHRDTLDLGFEDRFSEYDIFIDKPPALVPRDLRFTVPERMSARGEVLLPLDEEAVLALMPEFERLGIESIAIGFIHGYANAQHEHRTRELLQTAMPDRWISVSSEVCPEIREYERLSTTCANAYVQPLMAGYLGRLDDMLGEAGLAGPVFMMLSGGGLATLETARAFPVRLVESGPAGGAILAAHVAAECGLSEVLSFDMGGTTAKICLIDDCTPMTSRSFEVGRAYRFLKGSGLPLRIPVIEMVEIGAGGGSIASVDAMKRIIVGPHSAGAEPGPACYGRGGTLPTVTDANVIAGRIDPEFFAGGSIRLRPKQAAEALDEHVAQPLDLSLELAAFAVSEIVDENMANAARVHAIERGQTIGSRSIVAFGGAGPLHAARLAEKIGIDRIVVPINAGVGSAVGFLRAPMAYEVVRSRYMHLCDFDASSANTLLARMSEEATAMVRRGAAEEVLHEVRQVEARYSGQGHELALELPLRALTDEDGGDLHQRFEAAYAARFGRAVAGVGIELLNWSVAVDAPSVYTAPAPDVTDTCVAVPAGQRRVYDTQAQAFREVPFYWRSDLHPGDMLVGPALVVETQTTSVVPMGFNARIDGRHYLVMERRRGRGRKGE